MSLRIERVADATVMASMAVQRIEALAAAALRERGRFVAVISGDSAALAVCRGWAERGRVDFAKVVVVLADEQAVPAADPRSRRAALQAAFVDRIAARGLPTPEVLGVDGAASDRAQAAAACDRSLHALLPSGQTDLVLLGIGERGEVAGLLPADGALREMDAWCVGTGGAGPGSGGAATAGPGAAGAAVGRFTLTLPFLLRGRTLLLLAAGPERAAVLQVALQGRLDPERTPAQFFLRDERVTAILLADEAAHSRLKP